MRIDTGQAVTQSVIFKTTPAHGAKRTAVDPDAGRKGVSDGSTGGSTGGSPDDSAQNAQDDRLAAMQNALSTLQQAQKTPNATIRDQARRKVEQLKTLLVQLKLFLAGDPKHLAQKLAQIAKDLDAANKEYIRAGGSAGLVAASDAALPSCRLDTQADDPVGDEKFPDASRAIGAALADSPQSTPQSTFSSDPSTDTTTDADPTRSGTKSVSSAFGTALSSGDTGFYDSVRCLKRDLDDLVTKLKDHCRRRKINAEPHLLMARKSLAAIDGDLSAVARATQSAHFQTAGSTAGSLIRLSA